MKNSGTNFNVEISNRPRPQFRGDIFRSDAMSNRSSYSRSSRSLLYVSIALSLTAISSASAATRTVGPGKSYATPCKAFAAASDGDVIEIDGSVTYLGDVCGIYRNNLLIRGVNGRPKIDASGRNAMGKGTWVVIGAGTVIDRVEMVGAAVPDKNGAAIRLDGKHLTVRNSIFHNNQMGILTNNDGVSNIKIENSVFRGLKDPYASLYHNVYIGHVNSLYFRNNYSYDADVGHQLKSRAQYNDILSNRFSSTGSGQPSYEIDLPNAGVAYVIGNVIHQPSVNKNPGMLTFGVEGATNRNQRLYVVNNTFINSDSSRGTFILVGKGVTTPIFMQNNVFAGVGTVTNQVSAIEKTNLRSLTPGFVNQAAFDLRPAANSPMINAGSTPLTSSSGKSLAPVLQYKHIAGWQYRPVDSQIDIGAYEAVAP